MNESAERLSKCFRTVFPELDKGLVERADMTNVSRWDSVNQIMLMTVVDEEFNIELDLDDLDQLTSYRGILDYVSKRSS